MKVVSNNFPFTNPSKPYQCLETGSILFLPDSRPDAHILTVGDLHGNIFSLNLILKKWQESGWLNGDGVCSESIQIIFTGDLIDRGAFGLEVLLAVASLVQVNEGRVLLLSGNHESDSDVTATEPTQFEKQIQKTETSVNFLSELYFVYEDQINRIPSSHPFGTFETFFNSLPSGLLFTQTQGEGSPKKYFFAHGGFPSFDILGSHLDDKKSKLCVGNLEKNRMEWTDFSCNPERKNDKESRIPNRGILRFCDEILGMMKETKIDAFFRGHQHNDACDCNMWTLMQKNHGLVILWDETGNAIQDHKMIEFREDEKNNSHPTKIFTIVSCGSVPSLRSVLNLKSTAFLSIKSGFMSHHWINVEERISRWENTIFEIQ